MWKTSLIIARNMPLLPPVQSKNKYDEQGVILIIVMLILALASIIVVHFTYTTHLSSRTGLVTERSLKSEYLLKSALNLAKALIAEDTSPEDALQDTWAKFWDGIQIPASFLGVDEPNVTIELEIRSEDAKVCFKALLRNGRTVDKKWRDTLVRLFQNLGFDEDGEQDITPQFKGRVFTSEEMVANLIDFIDSDNESYSDEDFVTGIEGSFPDNYFPNNVTADPSELQKIPGFTPKRLRLIKLLVTKYGNNYVNINLAPKVLIKSLHSDFTDAEVDSIVSFRSGDDGPFEQRSQLKDLIDSDVYQEISNMIQTSSSYFTVVSKVTFENTDYFLRAILFQGSAGEIPSVKTLELY